MSQLQGFVTPHAKQAPLGSIPPSGNSFDLSSFGYAGAAPAQQLYDLTTPVSYHGHAAALSSVAYRPASVLPLGSTPEMEKRVRKRIGKALMKEAGKPLSEDTTTLKRIQKKLTGKDPALSRAITDAEPEIAKKPWLT